MAEKDSSRTRKAGRFEDARGRPVTLLGPYEMNRPMLEDESEALQPSIHRETPFSDELWRGRTAGDSASR